MRKIFTLAAAVLASFSLMAETWVLDNEHCEADNTWITADASEFTLDPAHSGAAWSISGVTLYKFKANKTYKLTLPEDLTTEKIMVIGYTNDASEESYFSTIGGQDVSATHFPVKGSSAASQETDTVTIDLAQTGGTIDFVTAGNKQLAVFITIEGNYPAAPTNPVGNVDVIGETSTNVNQKIKLRAKTDQRAEWYKWSVNGEDQASSDNFTFNFKPTAAGSYSIVAYAKNSNNSDWIASAEHVVTVAGPKEQVDITGTSVWDWKKASSESEIKLTDSSSPKKNDTIVLANISKMNNNSEFNSQALVFVGDYVVRTVNTTMKRCQGSLLQFNTTVPGYVSVEYSNTGNRTDEAERRFLTVNGAQVTGDPGSMKNDVSLVIYNVPVAAGKVSLSGVMPGSSEPTKPQPLSFYKVTFSTEQISTAIENTAEEVKAVKTFENGQLIIIKNGVKYNATGAIVK